MTVYVSDRMVARVVRALREHGPMTSVQLSVLLSVNASTMRAAVRSAHTDGLIHVHSRAPATGRGGPGQWIYAAGKGVDAVPVMARRSSRSFVRRKPAPAPVKPPEPKLPNILDTLRQRAATGEPVPAWLSNVPALMNELIVA